MREGGREKARERSRARERGTWGTRERDAGDGAIEQPRTCRQRRRALAPACRTECRGLAPSSRS
eukprot:9047580-Pyramimonas_sp.AAC.1